MKIVKIYSSIFAKANRVKNIFLIAVFSLSLSACSDKSAQEYVAEAKTFAEQGDNNAAIVALKNAIQKEPRNPKPRFELGSIYIQQNNFDSAEKELSKALELGYAANEVIPLLAQALQRSGSNVALSEIDTSEATLTSAEQLEVGFRKLQSLMQLERTLQAQKLIDELTAIDDDGIYKGLVNGYQQVLNKDFSGALATGKALYEQSPLNRDVLNFSARMHVITGDSGAAADIYENYIKVAPDDIETKFALASMLVEQRQPQRAEKYIDELLKVNDTNPLLNQLKGVVRAAADDYEGAKLFSEKAINGGRADPTLRLVAGLASYQLEDYEAAVGHLTLVASKLPDNHPGLRILAASQLQSNMGEDAGEILSRVNDISEQDASLLSRAGYELLKTGNTSAARDIIEQAEKISQSAEDLTRLGVLKLSINDIEGLLDLESAVEKAPQSATAKTTLASAYLNTQQFDKALVLASQWQQESPDVVDGYLLEAEVYQKQNKFDQAATVLNKASGVDATNVAVDISKIRLDLRQQKFDDALVKTENVLAKEPSNLTALASFIALKNQQKAPQEGIDRVKVALEKDKENSNLRLLLARASLAFNQPAEALETLKPILADRSAPGAYWPLMGVALIKSNRTDDALRHYAAWSELFPNLEAATIGQLVILDNKREFTKASQIASDFLANKDSIEIKLMQSYFLVMSRDVEASKRVLASVDEKFLALPFIRGVKARIAILEKRPKDGVEDALSAYQANQNSNNLLLVVTTLEANKQKDAAFKVLQEHIKRTPNDMQARMLIANRQIDSDVSQAISNYEVVLGNFPNNYVVLNNLAYLEMQQGNLEQAAEYGFKAYEIKPDDVATADTFAQILVRQGKVEDAVSAYNRVMSDKVTNEEVFVNYLEALWLSGSNLIAERRMNDLKLQEAESINRLAELKAKYIK